MSAVVEPHCGHAFHLMEVDSMRNAPQVHLHFLTDEKEYQLLGFSRVELCCHSCGESVLVYFSDTVDTENKHLALRDSFVEKHKLCPNHGFESWCPNWRSSFSTLDLRSTDGAQRPRQVPHFTSRRTPRRVRVGSSRTR